MSETKEHNPELMRLLEKKVTLEKKITQIHRVMRQRSQLFKLNKGLIVAKMSQAYSPEHRQDKIRDLQIQKEKIIESLESLRLVDRDGNHVDVSVASAQDILQLEISYKAALENVLASLEAYTQVYRRQTPDDVLTNRYSESILDRDIYKKQLLAVSESIPLAEQIVALEENITNLQKIHSDIDGVDDMYLQLQTLRDQLHHRLVPMYISDDTQDTMLTPADKVDLFQLVEIKDELERLIQSVDNGVLDDFITSPDLADPDSYTQH